MKIGTYKIENYSFFNVVTNENQNGVQIIYKKYNGDIYTIEEYYDNSQILTEFEQE